MSLWPLQSEVDLFYGNPRGRSGAVVSATWYAANIVMVKPPFSMHMTKTVTRFPIHKKCAEATRTWLDAVWANAGRKQSVIDDWGMSVFSGSYSFRPMRGSHHLSMHSYGCAMDFDAPRNALHDSTPHLATLRNEVIQPFLKLGGVWGGDWNGNGECTDEHRTDGMHFQFARIT
jgi:hypothetical protein